MKAIKKLPVLVVCFVYLFFSACNSSSNQDSSDTGTSQDSSTMNSQEEYPNNRIHIQDSNTNTDSSKPQDTVRNQK
jgi:hypothetical protein